MSDYGFTWGPMDVIRLISYRGTRVLGIHTHRHKLEVRVSQKGNSVRVWLDGKEMKA